MSLIGEEFTVVFQPRNEIERVRVVSRNTSLFGRRFAKSFLVRVLPRAPKQYTRRYNLLYEVAADNTTGISLDTSDWRLLNANGESATEWRVGDFVWVQFYELPSVEPEPRLSLIEVLVDDRDEDGAGTLLVYVHTGGYAGSYMRAFQQSDLSAYTRVWFRDRMPKPSLRPRFDTELPEYEDTIYAVLDAQRQ